MLFLNALKRIWHAHSKHDVSLGELMTLRLAYLQTTASESTFVALCHDVTFSMFADDGERVDIRSVAGRENGGNTQVSRVGPQ